MAEFQVNMEKMDLNEELMDDALAALDGDDIDEEVDDITNQVLDEIGVNLNGILNEAPKSSLKQEATAVSSKKSAAELIC